MPAGIENTDREGFGHYRAYLGFLYPAEPGNLRVLSQGATGLTAPEDQGHDSKPHVLVDASECQRLDDESGLFPDLAEQALDYRLIALENAAGRFPVPVVSALNTRVRPFSSITTPATLTE